MNSRQRRRLRRLSERMFKLCDLTRLRIAQDLDKFCSICTEAARRDSDKGGSPLPEHMLKENGERPTGRDSMFKSLDMSGGITGMSIKWKPDQEQPGIGERIFTGQLEITRDLMEFGVVKD